MERVEATLNGSTQNLPGIGKDRYQGKLNAPTTKAKEAVYPVMITATGDNGGVTEGTRDLIVRTQTYSHWNLSLPEKTEKSWDF